MKNARTPTQQLSKREVVTRGMEDDVIVPTESQHLSVMEFLKGLEATAMVTVPSRKISYHGLSGKPGNRSLFEQRRLFQSFISANRSPTGRTPDSVGRFHGAE